MSRSFVAFVAYMSGSLAIAQMPAGSPVAPLPDETVVYYCTSAFGAEAGQPGHVLSVSSNRTDRGFRILLARDCRGCTGYNLGAALKSQSASMILFRGATSTVAIEDSFGARHDAAVTTPFLNDGAAVGFSCLEGGRRVTGPPL